METNDRADAITAELAEIALGNRLCVAVAESLTSGAVASALGRAESSSEWFCGAVIAYQTAVKQRVLGATGERVVDAETAIQMARGVAELTGADLAVSCTGVGGPDSEEGQPPGTVWLGVWSSRGGRAEHHRFDGSPAEVVAATTEDVLRLALAEAVRLVPSG